MRAFPISTWDSHHFDPKSVGLQCSVLSSPPAIIIVDVSSLARQDTTTTYVFCTPAYVVLWRAAVGRRVCALLLLRFRGTEEGE
jgi:hypothetical protein